MIYEIIIGNKAYSVSKEVHTRYYSLVETNKSLRKDLADAKALLAEDDRFYNELRTYAISLEHQLGINKLEDEDK